VLYQEYKLSYRSRLSSAAEAAASRSSNRSTIGQPYDATGNTRDGGPKAQADFSGKPCGKNRYFYVMHIFLTVHVSTTTAATTVATIQNIVFGASFSDPTPNMVLKIGISTIALRITAI
jgi:hypothetical protein